MSGNLQSIIKALVLLLALSAPGLAQSNISTWSVARDTTLTKANGPYIISGVITVLDTVTLTIEAGAELRFGDNARLQVNGSLQAVGTESELIVFTSSTLNVFDGRWDGIVIDGRRSLGLEAAGLIPKSRLEWCDIGFGSYYSNNLGLVAVINNAVPIIKNCTIHNALNNGLWVDAQYVRDSDGIFVRGPEIRDNTFRANGRYGLHLQSTYSSGSGNTKLIDLAQEVPQRISGNRYESNGTSTGRALGVSLGHMTLERSYTWGRIDSQQVDVRGTITVARFDRDGEQVQLTVPAGTRIEFTGDRNGRFGKLYFEGALQAVGTSETPIEFVGRDREAGEWYGLEFFQAGARAQLEHVLVQHADIGLHIRNTAPVVVRNSRVLDIPNGSAYEAIRVDGAEPTIENCELVNLNGTSTGIRIADMRSIPTLKDNTVRGFADLMILGVGTSGERTHLNPEHLSRISGTTHSGNTRDYISLYNVTLLGDYTWGPVDGMEMRVGVSSGAWLAVPSNRTLTVPAGTTMRFRDSAWLNVQGTLEAVGTEAEPIVFTTANIERDSGRWYGVLIEGNGASASRVEWCTFSYGGISSNPSGSGPHFYGLLNVVDASPGILNNTFRFGRYGGLLVDAQYVADGGGLNGPTVENNTFADNEEFGLLLRSTVRSKRVDLAQVVPQFIKDNTYLRNGEIARGYNNSIGLGQMALATSYSWGQIDGQDLDVVGPLQVPRNDLQGNPIKLTIPAGTRVEFGQTASTSRSGNGTGQLLVDGELEALGTADERIVFVGLDEERNEWYGVHVRGRSAKGRLAHCEIARAGVNTSYLFNAGVTVSDGADVEVRNTLLRSCFVGVDTQDAAPLFENCEFWASAERPVRVRNAAFMPTLKNVIFRDNTKSLVLVNEGVLDPADLDKITGSRRSNNTNSYITLNNVSFGSDYVWQDQIDSLDMALEGTITIPSNIILTVPSGSFVRFWNGTYLNVVGTIEAIGTETAPINFTSANTPDVSTGAVNGSWYGVGINGGQTLALRQGGSLPESRFEWCVLSDGLGHFSTDLSKSRNSGNGLLNIFHASPSLRNIIFRNSSNAGLYVEGRQIFDAQGDTASTAMPAIAGARFLSNKIGMTLRDAMPQLARSAFVDNSDWGAQNVGTLTADISNNWWGSATGPTHASNEGGRGEKATDKILFANWLREAPGPVAKPRPNVTGLVGDIDGNGRVSIRDALIAAAYALDASILLPSGADIARGDVDGDGRVSLRDALVIATYVVDPANENLPPYIATKPAALVAGALERGDRVKVQIAPDAATRGYSLRLEWDANELALVGRDEVAAFSEQPGQLVIADLGSGALQPVVLEFEAQRKSNGAMRQYVEALAGDLSESVVTVRALVPQRFALEQNHPNPFNPSTSIRYALPVDADITLKIFNVQGQTVRTLVSGQQPAGIHQIQWDGRNDSGIGVGAGLYFYALEAGDRRAVHKMLLLK